MSTLTQTLPFRLTLKECTYHEVVVDAPDLDTAVDIVREEWNTGILGTGQHGSVVVFDHEGELLEEIDNWSDDW